MFNTLIVQPIYNLLVLIYALLPGHNFGLSIILFTITVRFLMWPLVKKQLYHTRAMRELQPELKRIKQQTKGDRQRESMLVMELYKERQINPFASFGIVLVQIPILISLYSGINRIVHNPQELINFSYPFIRDLSWMKQLGSNINLFDSSFIGLVNLSRPALDKAGAIYWPAMLIVVASAILQYLQSKQLMPSDKNRRSLRSILREAGKGKQADQAEVNAAVGRSTQFFIPALIFLFTVSIPSALSLYFLAAGTVAFLQQDRVLKQDETELVKAADKTARVVIEGEVVDRKQKAENRKQKKKSSKNKRRK